MPVAVGIGAIGEVIVVVAGDVGANAEKFEAFGELVGVEDYCFLAVERVMFTAIEPVVFPFFRAGIVIIVTAFDRSGSIIFLQILSISA